MDPEIDPKLEALLGEELKMLPALSAPTSLVPRVMAILAARHALPWWQRSWWDWPRAAKAAFLLVAVAIAGAFGGGGVLLDQGVVNYSQQVTERLAPASTLWDTALSLRTAAGLLWARAAQPLLVTLMIAAGLLYLICVGVGTAFVRSTLKRF